MVGEFKDDCLQDHTHFEHIVYGEGTYNLHVPAGDVNGTWDGTPNIKNGRLDIVTRGKRKGIKYIIKVL